ncbi:hypothetical protein ACH0BF_09015 [Pseudobacillus sp. 179-B 2D1 NHS]|uniref:hypothetical protein n=1 Tax=Pseudobacillus sp. 179-B 2D1 NHS TaxID=3374292 RepID=UPI0038796FF6
MTVENQILKRKVVPFSERSISASLPNLVISLSESKERIEQLKEFVEEAMVKGIDYGLVEGFSKPTLLKPGAEKLCDVFGFSKTVNVINRIEDWTMGIFAYEIKVTLTSKESGIVEAEGIGSCNNKESSLRQQDPYTVVNTVLKMAKKRALIDAVLSATRASGLFTQDIEDFPKQQASIKGGDELATKRQLQMIFRIVAELQMRPEIAKEMMQMSYNVDHSTQLTKKQASNFIQDLLHLKDAFEEGEELEIQQKDR